MNKSAACDICELTLQTFRAYCKVSIRHERKHKKCKNFVVRMLETKQVGNVFFTPWLPGKSDLGKVLKWKKIKRPLKLVSKQFKLRFMWHDWV